MSLDQFIPVLQLSIGPVIMISGTGLVLLSMTNRIARVIDRARRLAETLRSGPSSESHRIQGQLVILDRRGRMLRLAIAYTSTSLLLAAFLVIALFLVVLLDLEAALLIVAIFISSMVFLIIGLVYFTADVNASLAALKLEIGVEIYDRRKKQIGGAQSDCF
jgi:Cu/Ag efflux pump CusA